VIRYPTVEETVAVHAKLSDEHAVEWVLVEQLELLSGKRVRS